MRSQYCTTTPLSTDEGAQRYLAYSSLSGNIALIDELCHDLLTGNGNGDLHTDDQGAGTDRLKELGERAAFLAERGFLNLDDTLEENAARKLIRSIRGMRRQLLQLLFVFHPQSAQDAPSEALADAATAASVRLIERIRPRRSHFHFWIFEPFQVDLFHRASSHLQDVLPIPSGEESGEGSGEPASSFIINTSGLLPINIRSLNERFENRIVMKVVVDRTFIDQCDSMDEYLERLCAFTEDIAQQGQTSSLFLNVNRGSEELFMEELLNQLMHRGLNRSVVARYYVTAMQPKTAPVDFYCDLDGVDWDVWFDLIRTTASRPRYRMLSLYGGGVISKLQRLLNLKETLTPDLHFCPIIPNSFSFDLTGNVWVCPKTAFRQHRGEAFEPVGRYLPELEIDEDRLQEWWNWQVTDLPGCSGCADTFICGGGCPLEARVNSEPGSGVCQPVREFLVNGVQQNRAYLSRQFGPNTRTHHERADTGS